MADQKGTVATAYVQLIPSAEGIQSNIENAIVPQADDAGKKAGDSINKSLSATLQGAGSKISKLGGTLSAAVTAPIVGMGTAAVASWHEIDDAMDTVTQKTGASGTALSDMQNRAKEIAKTIPASFQDAGDAVGEVNTRFGLTGDALQNLSQQFVEFANLNDVEVSGSVDRVQTAMDAFGVSADDAGAVLDLFNSVGQTSGISMDTLETQLTSNATAFQGLGMDIDDSAQLLGKLEKSGVDASTVMTGLSRVQMNAAKDGKTMSEELQSALSDQATAIDIFGARAGAKLYESFQNGTLAVEDFVGHAGGLNDTMGSVSTTFDATLDPADQFTINMNKIKDAAAGLVDSAAPMITQAMGAMSDVIERASSAWNSLDAGQQQMIIKIAGIAAAVGPVLAIGGKAISGIGTLVGGVTKAGGAIGGIIGKITGLGGAASAASAPVQAAGTATGTLSQNALGLVAAGAGILLASAGLYILAQAAIQIAQAGAPAAVAMAGLVGAMALMAVGAAALAPALTAGAIGLVAFGAGVALIGVGALAAAAGMSMLAPHLSTISIYGASAAGAILQLSGSLLAFSGSSIAAGGGAVVLGAGLLAAGAGALVAGAGLIVCGAGATVAGAGIMLVKASTTGLYQQIHLIGTAAAMSGAKLLILGAGATASGAMMLVMVAGAAAGGAALLVFAAGAVASSAGAVALGAALTLVKKQMSSIAGSAKTASAGLTSMQSSINVVKSGMDALKSGATDVVNGIANAFKGGSANVIASAKTMSNGTVTAVKTGGNQMISAETSTMQKISSVTQSGFSNVSKTVKNGMDTSVSAVNSGAKQMSSAFNDIPASIGRHMSDAVKILNDSVNSMQRTISNVKFRFNQSMQLPHFSMSGDFDAKTKRVPTVSVSWYAQGGILTAPAIFGALGGNLLGGGEAGPEAVLPIENLKRYMREVLDERGNTGNYTQNVNIYSPTPLSPSEIARQTRNANRQFVLAQRGL